MKNIRLLILLLSGAYSAQCQQLSLVMPPVSGINLQLGSITSFTVLNSSTSPAGVNLRYQLKDIVGNILAQGYKNNLTAGAGATLFSYATHGLSYSEVSPSLAVDVLGNIPYGNYSLCVEVINTGNLEQLATGCTEVQVSLVSPPVLVSPYNTEEVATLNPLLSWLPPTPNMNQSFTYTLKLVEVLSNQNPYDAMLNNPALFQQQGLPVSSLVYPLTAQALIWGRTYAWMISVWKGNELVAETEVWSFRPVEQAQSAVATRPAAPIVVLDPDKHKKAAEISGDLRVQSDDLAGVDVPDFVIRDQSGKVLPVSLVSVEAEGRGIFRFRFRQPGDLAGRQYIIEIKTPKQRTLYASFKLKNAN